MTDPKEAIKKANLTFTVKFLWLILCHFISPQTLIISSHGIEQC